MQASVSSDGQSPPSDSNPKLRVDVIDEVMQAKGVKSVSAQARAFGLYVTHWFDIRSGRTNASLKTALRIAKVAETPVEKLWGQS